MIKKILKIFSEYEKICQGWEVLNLTATNKFYEGKAEGIRNVMEEITKLIEDDKTEIIRPKLWFVRYVDKGSSEYRIEVYQLTSQWNEDDYSTSMNVTETIVMANSPYEALKRLFSSFLSRDSVPRYFSVMISPHASCVKTTNINEYNQSARDAVSENQIVEIEEPAETGRKSFLCHYLSPATALESALGLIKIRGNINSKTF